MQTHLKRTLMILAAAALVLLLMPRGVTSQTPAANNASMVSEKIAATPGTANSASATKTDAELPSLKEILVHAEKAVGGEEAWKSVNTRLMKGVYQSEDSSAFVAMEIYQKSPDKTLYKMKLPQDITMRDVCAGNTAGIDDPRGGYGD